MVRSPELLEELNAAYRRDVLGRISHEQALMTFAGLWMEARMLNPDFARDWETDVAADVELARVLNGLAAAR